MLENKQHSIWWGVLALLYFIRLLLTQQMGLMPQDAYYFFYGQHLALSYFDHPPMIAYVLRGVTELFGHGVTQLKLADFFVTLGTTALFYQLASRFLTKPAIIPTVVLFASSLLVTVLSLNSTPDVPLMFFWMLSLLALQKAIFEDRKAYWPVAGFCIGLAFLSKYTAVFLLFGVFLFLLTSTRYRRHLWSWKIVSLLAGTILGAAPVLLWNIEHDWVSFLFQSSDRATQIMELRIRPSFFLGNLGTQALLLLPPLFIVIYYALYREGKNFIQHRGSSDSQAHFLLAFSLPLICFFTVVSLFYWVKLNWMMPAYISALILAGRYLKTSHLTYQLGFAVLFHLLLYLEIVNYPIVVKSDDTWKGWVELANDVTELKSSFPAHFIFSADDYKTSAILDFYLEDEVFSGNIIGNQGKQFSIIRPDLTFLRGENALFIDSDKSMKDTLHNSSPPTKLDTYFKTYQQLDPILIYDDSGRLIRKFWVYECKDYLPDGEKR